MFNKIIELLENSKVAFTVLEHSAEGRSEEVSNIRGTKLCEGAKAMVLKGTQPDKSILFLLAILPADKSIDLSKIKQALNLKKITFANTDDAKRLTGCEIGAIPPFSFNEELCLIIDNAIKNNEKVAFNAGSLSKSIVLLTKDYLNVLPKKTTFFDFSKERI